jgi:hypothetical protein
MKKTLILAAAALATISTAAVAQTYDGPNFVSKGSVQQALNLNNAGIQNGTFAFTYKTETVTEVSWTCTNTRNENVQERERTTTTAVSGVISSSARERNQITGFNLTGFSGAVTETSTSEGNQLNSCPTNWDLSQF